MIMDERVEKDESRIRVEMLMLQKINIWNLLISHHLNQNQNYL